MKVNNLFCIVTGGSSGLGKVTTSLLLDNNCTVIVFDLQRPEDSLFEKYKNLDFQKVDITNEIEIQNAFKYVINKYKCLHVLINCAGIGHVENILSIDKNNTTLHRTENFIKTMNINLIGTFLTCKYATLYMKKNDLDLDNDNERGVIINVASIAGIEGTVGQVAYAASKGGIIGMSMPLARELGQYNIRVSTIAPGPIDTGIKMAEYAEKLKKMSVIGRFGYPHEFAILSKHIIENPYLAGSVIRMDGGLIKPNIY